MLIFLTSRANSAHLKLPKSKALTR